jgi:hypothetical protein
MNKQLHRSKWALVMAATLALVEGCGSSDLPPGLQEGGSPSSTASGSFGTVLVSDGESASGDQTTVSVNYAIESCPLLPTDDPCVVPPPCASTTNESAGVITITGTSTIMVTPQADKTYPFQMDVGVVAGPGQALQIQAAGDDVPAHGGTVTMPTAVQLTSPAPGSTVPVDRSHDLQITWTPATSSSFTVYLSAYSGADPSTPLGKLYCTFRDIDGSGTISAAHLQAFPATASGDFAFLSVSRYNWTSTRVADWTVSFGGSSYVSVNATLQ